MIPGFAPPAGPVATPARFVHQDALRPGHATGPMMSPAAIAAALRRQSRLRMTAVIGWAFFSVAATFTKDTALALPALVLWLALTVGLPVYVTRANRAISASLKTASAVGAGGQITSAHAAGRMSLGHQALCVVAALFTYGFVARATIFALGVQSSSEDFDPVMFIVFAAGIGAAVAVYRSVKAQLAKGVAAA